MDITIIYILYYLTHTNPLHIIEDFGEIAVVRSTVKGVEFFDIIVFFPLFELPLLRNVVASFLEFHDILFRLNK